MDSFKSLELNYIYIYIYVFHVANINRDQSNGVNVDHPSTSNSIVAGIPSGKPAVSLVLVQNISSGVTTDTKTEEVHDVINAKDVAPEFDPEHLQSCHLGRGYDSIHKKIRALQIRPVTKDNTIVSRGEGMSGHYKKEENAKKTGFDAEISADCPGVPIIRGGLSASGFVSSTKKMAERSKIIHTCTVSFKDNTPVDDTFENVLHDWIQDKVKEQVENMSDEDLFKQCHNYIDKFRVTHYLSSIDLGYSEDEIVIDESKDVDTQLGAAIDTVKGVTAKGQLKHSRKHNTQIGTSHNKEGLIHFKSKHITDLITGSKLKEQMENAMVWYEDSQSIEGGCSK